MAEKGTAPAPAPASVSRCLKCIFNLVSGLKVHYYKCTNVRYCRIPLVSVISCYSDRQHWLKQDIVFKTKCAFVSSRGQCEPREPHAFVIITNRTEEVVLGMCARGSTCQSGFSERKWENRKDDAMKQLLPPPLLALTFSKGMFWQEGKKKVALTSSFAD